MGSLLDYIGSTIIFGILILTLARVQGNMNSTTQQSTFNLVTQKSGITLARQIEIDFLRIGHHVRGQKILLADSTRIVFRADIANTGDTVLVAYLCGSKSQALQTENPNDFPIYRFENGTLIRQNFGVTDFHMSYYDSANVPLTMPIVMADSLKRIRSITVRMTVMNPDPVHTDADTIWSAITWEKTLIPRNITKIDL
jgi:hypothetical protein